MKKLFLLTILTALMLMLGSLGAAQAEIIPPHGFGQIGLRAERLCQELTVREEPSVSSNAVETLEYGDFVIVMEQTDGWVYCTLGDAEDSPTGWVNSDYLAIDPAWYRTEDKTPIYAWDDTEAPKVALLDKDTTLPILKDEGEWLIVSLRGATGWIYRQDSLAETVDPVELPEAGAEAARQDGERFETVIKLEGMEETIRYEHIRSDVIGVEMDYDYESLERNSESDRELFVSRYDNPEDPLNYLEVSYSAEDAEAVRASISEALSRDYNIIEEQFTLDHAGDCIRIDASSTKGGQEMPELLQTVYVIPAADGCRIATAHYTNESAEGFGTRFHCIMNTLAVIDRQAE